MESLHILFFRLTGCGLGLDRDLNAIIRIGVAGSALETLNAHGGDGRWAGSDQANAGSREARTKTSRKRREAWSWCPQERHAN